MIKFPWFKKPSVADGLWAAVDLGSSSVKVVTFVPREGKVGVLGFGSAPQEEGGMCGGVVADLTTVAKTARTALDQAVFGQETYPRRAVVGAGAEMIRGFVTRARITRPNSESPLDEKEWNRTLDQLGGAALAKASEELSLETGQEDLKIEPVGSYVAQVFLDGLEITNPLGFKGKSLEVALYSTFAPRSQLASLQTITSFLKFKDVTFSDTNFPLLRGAPDQILLDVGGQTTEVAVQVNHGIIGTRVVPLGGEHLKESSDEVFSWWLAGVELALETTEAEELPGTITLVGGGSLLPQVSERLSGYSWGREVSFSGPLQIKSSSPDTLKNVIDQTGKLKSAAETVPAALTLLAL